MKQIYLILLFLIPQSLKAQDDLMGMLEDSTEVIYKSATFKANRIINGHSVETVGKKNLDFVISHRFDRLNNGFNEFFGLDAATIRLGLEYGLNDRLMIGIGRSSYQKVYDYFGKYKLFRQTSNSEKIPLSLTLVSGYAIRTQKTSPSLSSFDRGSYFGQFLLARKFDAGFSLQVSPTLIHRNRPDAFYDSETVFSTGFAGMYKISKRASINGEYNYVLANQIDDNYTNNFSLSLDLETGGHIFQLLFTNSFGMTERQFITETNGSWGKGDIHFGFNISRTFSFEKKNKNKW
jgi:hypothetical protein